MLKRICKACGIKFDGGPRAWYCPKCRDERKRIALKNHKERKKLGNSRIIGEKYPCEICGKIYTLNGGLQRYCPECAKIHLKEVDNVQSREWAANNKDKVVISKDAENQRNLMIKSNLQWQSASSDKIKELREQRGLSQHRLSVISGLDAKAIARLENRADINKCSLLTLEKISAGLNMDIIDFLKLIFKKD